MKLVTRICVTVTAACVTLFGVTAFGQVSWSDPGPKPNGWETMTLNRMVDGASVQSWDMWGGTLTTGSPITAGLYRVNIDDALGARYVDLGTLTNGAYIDTSVWSVTYPDADPVGSGLLTAFWSGFLLACGFYGFGWKMRLVRQIGRAMPEP